MKKIAYVKVIFPIVLAAALLYCTASAMWFERKESIYKETDEGFMITIESVQSEEKMDFREPNITILEN